MIKGYLTHVAKEIGRSPALVLNQILQWYRSGMSVHNKLFRTDDEMLSDLDNVISLSTFRRAKTTLVDLGYVEVSYGKGYNRTTHYTLTEKSISLMLETTKTQSVQPKKDTAEDLVLSENIVTTTSDNNTTITEHTDVVEHINTVEHINNIEHCYKQEQKTEFLPKDLYIKKLKAEGKYKPKQYNQSSEIVVTKSMKDSFDKQGEIRENVVKPKVSISDMLKQFKKDNSNEALLRSN